MKPEAQRIAIAEACGWIDCELHHPRGEFPEPDPPAFVRGRNRKDGLWMELPNYPSDLNACHEMEEEVLTDEQWTDYLNQLYYITFKPGTKDRDRQAVSSTAAQRVEAFLQILGLWIN